MLVFGFNKKKDFFLFYILTDNGGEQVNFLNTLERYCGLVVF